MRIFLFSCLLISTSCTQPVIEPIDPLSTNIQEDLLTSLNALRTEGCFCGAEFMPPVSPLTWNVKLELAAGEHAQDMYTNDFFDHKGSDNSQVWDRVLRAGYDWRAVGENIAWGFESVDKVMDSWKNSPGHCKTMMSKEYEHTGAAKVGTYWVQTFAR